MIRFLYTVCDLLAGLFAVVSPVVIFHWLLKAVNHSATQGLIDFFTPIFEPLNSLLEFFIKLPDLQFQDQAVSTTQGLLACLLTGAFFVLTYLSETLKATEQRLDVGKQALIQRRRLQQLKAEEQKHQKQVSTSRRVYAYVQYEFSACPPGGAFFETGYVKFGGKALQSFPNAIGLEFDSLDQAFRYSLEASQGVLSHYATLRPMDPQPPFRVAIHAVDAVVPPGDSVSLTSRMAQFAGPNQVIFSQDARQLMEALGMSMGYHFQSLGMYNIGNQSQEFFRLFYQKRLQNF